MIVGKENLNMLYKNHEDPWNIGFSGYHKYRYKECLDILLRSVPQGSSLLDVGCSKGYFLKKLCETNHFSSLGGVDISEVAIEQAKKICGSYACSLDVQELPYITYNGKQFDVVLALEVVYYFHYHAERKAAVKNIFDLIKNGGYALISIAISDGWGMLYNDKKESYVYESEIKLLFHDVGFEIVETQIMKDTWFVKLYKKICWYYDWLKVLQKKAILTYPGVIIAKYVVRFLISSTLLARMGMFFNSFSSGKPSIIFFLLKKPIKV